MASKYRELVANRTLQTLKNVFNGDIKVIPKVHHIVQNTKIQTQYKKQDFRFQLPSSLLFDEDKKGQKLSKFIEEFHTDDRIWAITSTDSDESASHSNIQFHISTNRFVKEVVCEPIRLELSSTEKPSSLLRKFIDVEQNGVDKIVIDFSSPNVAKPFHMGHLRSTIIGNFIANIHEAFGHDVVRLNYLGDWGTQFGYLLAGLKRHGIENVSDLLKICDTNTKIIHKLNEIYVESNKLAESDPALNETAKDIFARLDSGDSTLMKEWEFIRKITVDELDKTYKRLNVCVNVYHGESMYNNNQNNVAHILEEKGLLHKLEDGREVIKINDSNNNVKDVTIRKSDGSSLYLTRDIAAALDRKRMFDFNKMLYVVETAQSDHFKNLFNILSVMGHTWSQDLNHISFGRIKGMSSRKGTSVFLSDILDEGMIKMIEQQKQSSNTKVQLEDDDYHEIADVLAISAVVCNDLKQKRNKDYAFNWENILHSKGDSGIKLQYTHARLTSLLLNLSLMNENYEYEEELLKELINPNTFNSLIEPEAIELVHVISLFDETVRSSYLQLEPCILVKYLYRLCNVTSKGLKQLGVKTAPTQIAANERLMLFASARVVLKAGMKILGLKPLNRI